MTLVYAFSGFNQKAIAACLLCCLASLTACSERSSNNTNDGGDLYYETLTLRFHSSQKHIELAELANQLGFLAPIKLDRTGNQISEAHTIQAVTGGEIDFGSAFNGLIVESRLNGSPVKAVVGAYVADDFVKSDIYVRSDSPHVSLRDLSGKSLAIDHAMEHPLFVLKDYFERYGMNKDFINQIELVVTAQDAIVAQLQLGQIDAALLTESPEATIPVRRLRITPERSGELAAGSYFFTDSFIKNNPHTVEKFVEAIARTIEWMRQNPLSSIDKQINGINRRQGKVRLPVEKTQAPIIYSLKPGGQLDNRHFQHWLDLLGLPKGEGIRIGITADRFYENGFNPYLYSNPDLKRQAESVL